MNMKSAYPYLAFVAYVALARSLKLGAAYPYVLIVGVITLNVYLIVDGRKKAMRSDHEMSAWHKKRNALVAFFIILLVIIILAVV